MSLKLSNVRFIVSIVASISKRLLPGIALASLLATQMTPAIGATGAEAAAARVQSLNDGLAAAAKKGDLHGATVRQIIDQSFNLQIMAQIVVGESWKDLSAAERADIVGSMARYTEAREAYEFHNFTGEPIRVDKNVQVRGLDALVRAEVLDPPDEPLQLIYRLREYAGQWQIIDVVYNGVSQLALQRADFAGTIATSGPSGLVKQMDAVTARLK